MKGYLFPYKNFIVFESKCGSNYGLPCQTKFIEILNTFLLENFKHTQM